MDLLWHGQFAFEILVHTSRKLYQLSLIYLYVPLCVALSAPSNGPQTINDHRAPSRSRSKSKSPAHSSPRGRALSASPSPDRDRDRAHNRDDIQPSSLTNNNN